MRVAAAISTWLGVGFFAVFAMGGTASADILDVEPDLFPVPLTVLNNAFPGVTLSNQTNVGDPDETDVLVRGIGTDIPMTGDYVFGRESAVSTVPRSLILWSQFLSGPSEDSAALRADFVIPVDIVSIQASTPDNGVFRLEAYNAAGEFLERVDDGGRGVLLFAEINRSERDISYVLAWGIADQPQDGVVPLDDLQVNFSKRPVFINIKPDDDQNQLNICAKKTLPVAILSYDNRFSLGPFDATDVDPFSVDLEGAGVKTVGKNPVRAKFKIQDVNGDSLQDMVVEIDTKGFDGVDETTEEMTLAGLSDGTPFVGKDAVDITQFMCVRSLE